MWYSAVSGLALCACTGSMLNGPVTTTLIDERWMQMTLRRMTLAVLMFGALAFNQSIHAKARMLAAPLAKTCNQQENTILAVMDNTAPLGDFKAGYALPAANLTTMVDLCSTCSSRSNQLVNYKYTLCTAAGGSGPQCLCQSMSEAIDYCIDTCAPCQFCVDAVNMYNEICSGTQ